MDKQFIQKIGDKDFVRYEGLLNEAHERGLVSIETELVELTRGTSDKVTSVKDPDSAAGAMKDKITKIPTLLVLFKATVTLTHEDGHKVFTGYGDATYKNVNPMVLPHLIRMAETRAKARALRDACNIGMCSAEEM